LQRAKTDRDRTQQLTEKNAAGAADLVVKNFAVQLAETQLAEAQAELDRMLAGSWDHDREVARAELDRAQANVEVVKNRLERRRLRSPVAGEILKRLVEVGEFISPERGAAFVIGDLSNLQIRVQVDESEAPFVRLGAAATAMISGNTQHELPLRMLHIEPLCIPKNQLTGSDLELVDTRVVEIIFAVDASGTPDIQLYPGQVLDVFIDADGPQPPDALGSQLSRK
jgi:multidrug resistance efflux pump